MFSTYYIFCLYSSKHSIVVYINARIHIPCNTSILSRLYNPRPINLTRYTSSLAICVSHFFFSFQLPNLNSVKLSHLNWVSLSLPNALLSQPDCASTILSTSTLALCVSLKSSTPSSPLPAYPIQTHQQKQRKNSNSPSETKSPNTQMPHRALFRPR